MPMAEPKAFCRRNIPITTDFIDGGALVKAYSRPVMEAKISLRPMSTYAGVCAATCTLFGSVPPSEAGQESGESKQGPVL